MPTTSRAHPHSWITVSTTINTSNDLIQSLSMNWEFDPMTSAYMLSGEGLNKRNQDDVLEKLASSVITNLLSSHYFTYFYINDQPIRYKRVDNANLQLNGAKLTLTFDLPIAKPISLYNSGIRLLVFDPTYYIDMLWETSESLNLTGNQTCIIRVTEPNPTSEQVAYALSLGPDESPDNDLGQLFTQSAEIDCD